MLPLPPVLSAPAAVPVRVVEEGGAYRLVRGGKPFFVRGAGGIEMASLLPKYGGNAARTWGSESAKADLETCRKAGIVLQMGVWLPHQSEGFDYADPAKVEELRERVRGAVAAGKGHPSLLTYGLGNEMETGRSADPTVWRVVGELASLIHKLDPAHPVVTVVADFTPEKIAAIKKYAPAVDILGSNSYGGAASVPERLRVAGWTKPYLVTEFGPNGPWEVGKAPWGAAFEPTSSEKIASYANAYRKGVLGAPDRCLGSFAFLWGYKQEETLTWFGMFLPGSTPAKPEPIETVAAMSALWLGKPLPQGRIKAFSVDASGKDVTPGETITAELQPLSKGVVTVEWTMRRETANKAGMGTGEKTEPVVMRSVASAAGTHTAAVPAPKEPGAYRLYGFLRDGSGFVATANAPFRVVAK